MRPRHARLGLVLLLLTAACAGGPETPIVATNSPLAPESVPPVIPSEEAREPSLLDPNRVVARVNDEILTVRSLRAQSGDALRAMSVGDEENLIRVLDEITLRVIQERLFLTAARRLGVVVTEEEMEEEVARREKQLADRGTTLEEDLRSRGIPRWEWEADARRDLVVVKFLRMKVGVEAPMSPETRASVDTYVRPVEVREYYERNLDTWRQSEFATADALIVRFRDLQREEGLSPSEAEARAREMAEGYVSRLRAGESPEDLPPAAERLDMGLDHFVRGTKPAYVEEFAWTAPVGSVSDPIHTPPGYLILTLRERQEAKTLSFSEAKDEIYERLRALKFEIAQWRIQAELLEESVILPGRFRRDLERIIRDKTREALVEMAR